MADDPNEEDAAVAQTVADSAVGTSDTLVPARRDSAPALVQVDPSHYTERRELTHGGMGRIVAARDVRLDRKVAIKELRVQSPELRARFEREALLTARLQHPSIVSIHEAGRWPSGEPFYAMKLVPGRPLDQVIAGTATLAQRLALLPHVVAVADALAYAHQQRVIHRDLKPQNVLVGEFGETVVIDWGLAKDLADSAREPSLPNMAAAAAETAIGDVLGTPAYMPPEQAEGIPVDERADVYAIGAMLYHVACGEPPYVGKSTHEILDAVRERAPTPLGERAPALPPDLVAIVARAMARDPAARYRTARELAQDLHRFQAGQLVGAHRYSTRELVRRWLRRHRIAVTVAALAALVLLAVAIVSVRKIVHEEARLESAFERAARAQLATAHGLVRRDLARLDTQAEQVALASELVAAMPSKERVAEHLAREAASLPSGLVQVLDANLEPVADVVVGGQDSRFERVRAGRDSALLERGAAHVRGGFEVAGGVIVARAVAPILDANLVARGFVVLTQPLDEAYANELEAQLHTDVVFQAGGSPAAASLPGHPTELAAPPGPLGAHGSLARRKLAGRPYLLAFGELADDRRRVLGTLGVVLPHGDQIASIDTDTLVVATLADAKTLDPAAAIDSWSTQLIVPLYDTLVRYRSGTNELEPGLAHSWQVSADGLAWTFQLRSGVRFHDGTPLDADAVVYSFERQREGHPDFQPGFTYWQRSFSAIRKIERVAPDVVRFELARPFSPFLSALTTVPASIVSPAAVKRWGADYGKHPVGTGPYAFESWRDELTMRRNPDYRTVARTERLVFVRIGDPQQRVAALQSGAVDIALELLPKERQQLAREPEVSIAVTHANSVAYVAINTSKLPDRTVRQAIAHAIHKHALVQNVFQGLAVPALGPLPPTMWGFHEPTARHDYDPEQARRLLAQAGWDPNRVLRIYVSLLPRPYMPRPNEVARTLQANLAAAGIRTELVLQPFDPTRLDIYAGKHDLCVWGWIAEHGDPDTFLQLFDSDNAVAERPLNFARFVDREVHDLLVAARAASDYTTRAPLYAKAQERIAAEAPWVPLAHTGVAVGVRANIRELKFRISEIDFARIEKTR